MTAPRISVLWFALCIVVIATAAAPTRARANDFAMPFGGKAAPQLAATAFGANADESGHWSAIRLASSFANHESHSGLGGSIASLPAPRVVSIGEKEDEGGWRHHDDDGDDDGHRTPVPEPPTAFLVFSGIATLGGWRLRYKQDITPTNLA
jgi:hypothetical protein